jgi:hypothetical protein
MISQDALTFAISNRKLTTINEVPTNIEKISSVVEGYNDYFKRYKMVGEYPLKDLHKLLVNLDTKLKEFELEEDGRVCARIFIPKINSNNLNALNVICSNRDYEVEYLYDHTFKGQPGCIALIGKNGVNRPVVNDKVDDSKILKILSRPRNIQVLENSETEKSFKFVDGDNLKEEQIAELTKRWQHFFGPSYDKDVVRAILENENIVKVIALNELGNVVAALIAEPDNLDGIEITEAFSLEPSITRLLLSKAIQSCREKYPKYKIFLEANTASAAPYIAFKAGMSVAGTNDLNNRHVAKAHAKVNPADSSEIGYNNFIVFTYVPEFGLSRQCQLLFKLLDKLRFCFLNIFFDGRFFRKERIRSNCTHNIKKKIADRAMSCMFNLTNVF